MAVFPAYVCRSTEPRRRLALFLVLVAAVAVVYLLRFVRPYLSLDPGYYEYFWPWRYALWAHLAGGATALLIGPVQLWLGLTRRQLPWHRRLGKAYLCAVVVSLAGAAYLIAKEIRTDWVFASGLLGLACAWTITTGSGYVAIRRGQVAQHQEWMIRSYVVASAFVFLRIFTDLLHLAGVHDASNQQTPEELKLAAWLCWSVPLLFAEPLIQWRRIRRAAAGPDPRVRLP